MKLSTRQQQLLSYLQRNPGIQTISHNLARTAKSLKKRGLIELYTYEKQKGKEKPLPQAKIK